MTEENYKFFVGFNPEPGKAYFYIIAAYYAQLKFQISIRKITWHI